VESIDLVILRNLMENEPFCRKVLPYLKEEYFSNKLLRVLFTTTETFIQKYNALPAVQSLKIALAQRKGITDEEFKEIGETLDHIHENIELTETFEWLVDEKFCKEKSLYNAIMESVNIISEPENSERTKEDLPTILSDALAVSFDMNVGHDYFDNSEDRFEFYHKVESRLPFGLDYLNKITNGGLPPKSLSIIMGGTGSGKTIFLCHFAADAFMMGKNVLYITLEMSEEKIAERIDANLLGVDIANMNEITKPYFDQKIEKLKGRTTGRLVIKEYPTASVSVAHFRHLVRELKIKKNFIPDVIYLDYINLCRSARYKGDGGNTYALIKSVSEEIRGFAVENNIAIVSATQCTRNSYQDMDVDLTGVAESWGLPAITDLFLAIITSEELDKQGQVVVKQLKNRYNDVNLHRSFLLGLDRSRMRLFDVKSKAASLMNPKSQLEAAPTSPTNKIKDNRRKLLQNIKE